MSVDREQLEKQALLAVCADDYYELCDNLETTTNEELERIIEDGEAEDRSSNLSSVVQENKK